MGAVDKGRAKAKARARAQARRADRVAVRAGLPHKAAQAHLRRRQRLDRDRAVDRAAVAGASALRNAAPTLPA